MFCIPWTRTQKAEGTIKKDSLSEAILEFSEYPGVFEEDVLSEIGLFFVAGKLLRYNPRHNIELHLF